MRFFTLHERPGPTGGDPQVVAVASGFSWWAAIMPPLWLLRHRLWLGLIGYLLLSMLWGVALELGDIAEPAATVLALGLSFLIGAMAADYRRWTLTRRGWRFVDVQRAEDAAEAEERYIRGRAAPVTPTQTGAATAPVRILLPQQQTDAFPRLV
ncbi:MAG: DUF2628 domain-containing protein [Ferrovibrio sp.]|uniref:DUF2628 domain-containing protein n=1 Tax=Ferrovibrio sp. TaxID=1917215 RepID=UPI003919DA1E